MTLGGAGFLRYLTSKKAPSPRFVILPNGGKSTLNSVLGARHYIAHTRRRIGKILLSSASPTFECYRVGTDAYICGHLSQSIQQCLTSEFYQVFSTSILFVIVLSFKIIFQFVYYQIWISACKKAQSSALFSR